MKKSILFITQHLGRTGSEMVLWYLLKDLDPNKYSITLFCKSQGEMFDSLPSHIEKHIMYKYSPKKWLRFYRKLIKFFGVNPIQHQLNVIQQRSKADVWFVNTVAFPEIFEIDKPKNVKFFTYVHELLYAFSEIKRTTLEKAIAYSDVCIGCSDVVCNALFPIHQFVEKQYSFIDTDTIKIDTKVVDKLKELHDILPTDFVWVVSGGTKYMKGFDLVLPILDRFSNQNIKILWLGSEVKNGLTYYVKHIADEKYPGRLICIGAEAANYYNYMAIANGFLLLSREETFSLVMLEAAYLQIPIVAFNVGIAANFVKNEMGFVAYNNTLEEMVDGMVRIHEHSSINKEKLRDEAMRFSKNEQLPKFEQLLERII
ncbi:glycosyltransferase family 4 protein [Pedobacter psychrodurus]|uniref:glycosyltransferase family 4 protein n=1 Tax=Pedobacter psychrodurus TaxID=2530456 RepID=UPI00292F6AF0|nr:glycosyltransferase family 4 protein [Pedobacter psychrodurus]